MKGISVIEIDGGIGEGGGQMLRSSLTLSALTGKPFRMVRIRANRPKPGLAAQHLEALLAMARICDAEVEGATLGSSEIVFRPKSLKGGEFEFEIKTAGSSLLLLQTVYLPLAFAGGGRVSIIGGTHTKWSPSYDYIRLVFSHFLEKVGLPLSLSLERAGYYPKGGGRITAEVPAVRSLSPLKLEKRGEMKRLFVFITLTSLPWHIAEREISTIQNRLKGFGKIEAEVVAPPATSPGNAVLLLCEFEDTVAGFAAVGEKGRAAEEVADEVAEEALSFLRSDGAVDARCADQLLLPFATVEAECSLSTNRLSEHIKTNIYTISRFIEKKVEMFENENFSLVRLHERL
ncbi:MAG: RNA 3'-terminal phosphate cyclase [Planctomycetota bacterium]|nr:RNA 3'-terminal phosphate cyclase [Planctomycetota bacterium]